MRRLNLAISFLATFALSASVARAAVVNGSFEDGGGSLSGWTTFNNFIPNVEASSEAVRTGGSSAKVFGGFNGNPNAAGLFQGAVAAPGEVWRAGAYARHNSGDSLAGSSNRLSIKIEFYRVFGGAYGTSDMVGEHEMIILDGSDVPDVWHYRALEVVAPAEAVEARIALVFLQYADAGGAAFIDDVSFEAISAPESVSWELLWADEFDGPDVDPSKWRIEDIHLIKNNELQYYTPEDVYIDSGALVLRSQERTYWGYDTNGSWRQFDYTSGLVETQERFATTYGRIEVRAWLPSTQGIWPAHWMLPASGAWPPEIDVMELLGDEPTRIYMTHHWGTWPNVISAGGDYAGPDFSAGWHTFAVEWFPDRLDWYVDGVRRFVSASNIPQEPFYVILNTAVGGNWPGNPDATTVFPQYHLIDYVRVYMPVEMGTPMAEIVDGDPFGAVADGQILPGEYAATMSGINAGFGDMIGSGSLLHFNSSGQERFGFGIESAVAWPSDVWPGGAVIYVDSRPGGLASTYELSDAGDVSERMVSGTSTTGVRSDLFFALGFRADFAICIEPQRVTVYELTSSGLTLVNGAAAGATLDENGGRDLIYRIDDGSSGFRIREIDGALSVLDVSPEGSFDFVVTMINGDAGYRSNEFVGVTSGNSWDADNIGSAPCVLKVGDFVRATTTASLGAAIPSVSDWGLVIMALLLLCAGTCAAYGTPIVAGEDDVAVSRAGSKETRR